MAYEYHPAVEKFVEKADLRWDKDRQKYYNPTTKRYMSHATVRRAAAYFERYGWNRPLSEAYGLKKQRTRLAGKRKVVKVAYPSGMRKRKSKTVLREMKRKRKGRKVGRITHLARPRTRRSGVEFTMERLTVNKKTLYSYVIVDIGISCGSEGFLDSAIDRLDHTITSVVKEEGEKLIRAHGKLDSNRLGISGKIGVFIEGEFSSSRSKKYQTYRKHGWIPGMHADTSGKQKKELRKNLIIDPHFFIPTEEFKLSRRGALDEVLAQLFTFGEVGLTKIMKNYVNRVRITQIVLLIKNKGKLTQKELRRVRRIGVWYR